ncbi:hypothetical protein V8E53_006218 [Lactarius tabidus]
MPQAVPNHEDDIIAALEHPFRVRSIKLVVTSHLFGLVTSLRQESFLALETLWLSSKDRNAPVLPDGFMRGPAPQLRQIFLEGISFPAFPTLLSSASNLVDLQLEDIPQSGYISPEVMVTSLAASNRLEGLYIGFNAPISRHQLRSSPSLTPHVLPSLVAFDFRGSSEYLEHLLAQIDTPRLRVINITYFNQLDFQVPQLFHFIRRTEYLELALSRHMQVRIRISNLRVALYFEGEVHSRSPLTLCISCKWLDWQILHLTQILAQSPAMVSNVDHLSIDDIGPQLKPCWDDGMNNTDWLELLRPFTAVKTLHGSQELAGHIALALDNVGGEMTAEVLPALTLLSLGDQPVRFVETFLAVRQLSGHPVTFATPALKLIPFVSPIIDSATHHQHHGQANLLIDGFIAHSFSSEDASSYLKVLLRALPSEHFLQYYGILHNQSAWYITHNGDQVQGTSPGVPPQAVPLLDYIVMDHCMVVPQRRWALANELDFRRNVENAVLQLPIFFINRMGGLGFRLSDILEGHGCDLRNANNPAPLGGKTITHIRIGWPGYRPWVCQIPIRDETRARNPITLGRFMKQVGRSVAAFLREGTLSNMPDPRWKIGPGGITQQDVILIGAINVSARSWMPILHHQEKPPGIIGHNPQ